MLYLPPESATQRNETEHGGQLRADPDAHTDWPALFIKRQSLAKDTRLREYYAAGMIAGDTPLSEAPLLAVDFETTGLDARKHGIVSIGAVPFSLNRVRLAEARYWLLKPRRELTEESVVIHEITHSDVEEAPDLDRVLADILKLFQGHVWVVHYRGIERDFFKHALLARLGEHIDFPVIDTMQLEARLHRDKKQPWYRRWRTGSARVSIRLADSRRRYNLPHYAPHDATTDALACAELFQAQVAHHYSPDTPIRDIWVP